MRSRLWALAFSAAVLVIASGAPAAGGGEKLPDERWYRWSLNGEPAGHFHIRRSKSGFETAPVLLSYEFVVKWRGATFWQHVKAYCRDDRHLSAVRIVIEGTNDDGRKEPTSESTISGGTLVRTREGARRYEAKAPGKVMTEFTIFEVIRRLPFEKGVVLEFTSVEEGSHVKEGHKITYAGKELVRVGRDLVELHRFDQTGPAIRPMQLWVDDNHELIRVVMDGRKEFLLTTKADATAAFRADGPADR